MTDPVNIDADTVKGFGEEWSTFTQEGLPGSDRQALFNSYFSLIDWHNTPRRVLDMGCGSGRWDSLVASKVRELVLADASKDALQVAKTNVIQTNVSFVECTPSTLPFPDGYFDLVFSLGVLHHVPDTRKAIEHLVKKICPGGTLLLYLYYAFDNRPFWFRTLWRLTDLVRRTLSRLPFTLRYVASQAIAIAVYWPLARTAKYFKVPSSWPLNAYAERSFYVMRTDALDRFGTKLEKRFTRPQIVAMLESVGLQDIQFSDSVPYWVCKATKQRSS